MISAPAVLQRLERFEMAVQMAASANDLAPLRAPAKAAVVSADGGAEFKNILQGMREFRQTRQTQQNQNKTSQAVPKEPKTPVNFAFPAGEDGESAASLDEAAAVSPTETETTPDDGAEVKNVSRFDPDVFLEALEGVTADKSGKRPADAKAKDAVTPEAGLTVSDAAPDAGENEAQSAAHAETDVPAEIAALSASAESNATAQINLPAEMNDKTAPDTADAKELSAAERPQTVDIRDIQSGEAKESAAEDASRRIKPRESQPSGMYELPDTNDNAKNTDNAGNKETVGGENGIGEKNEANVPKAASDASDIVHKTGGREDAAAENSHPERASSEKPSAERVAEPTVSYDNPFSGQIRTETQPFASDARIYTLMSGDKFGEGLRSVLTLVVRDGGAEARIVVEPPALGRVDISLRSSESGVEANFKVDNEELRQMVQKQFDSLKESLQAQGIHVSGMTVDIKNSEGERNRGNAGASKKGRRQSGLGAADDIEDIEDGARVLRLDLEKGLLHWVA